MLSRVADTIYWLARYMERTNGILQALRTNYIASQDEIKEFSWRPLLITYSGLKGDEITDIERDSSKVLEYLIVDRTNGASAYNYIMQSRENARSIQDNITKEVWQCLNDFYHFIRNVDIERELKHGDPVSAIDQLIKQGLLFTGTVDNTMTRDEGFTYLNIGKFLERAVQTTDLIRMKMSEFNTDSKNMVEAPTMRYLLYSLFGYEMYIKTYKGNFTPENVLQLVVYNTHFPHSVLYCLERIYKYFERLNADSVQENYDQLDFLIGRTMNNIKYSNVNAHDPAMLNNFLHQTKNDLFDIGSSLSKLYFGNT
jgi:uncharacterized alpha-E superfamily protein